MPSPRSLLLITGLLAAATAAQAEPVANPITVLDGTLTTTGTLASDYLFRGFSLNHHNITPELGVDWMHQSGFHLNAFITPVDLSEADDAHVETDLTGGYTHSFTPELSGDLSVTYYAFPGANTDAHTNFVEGLGSLSYDFKVAKVTGLAAYSPEFGGHTGTSFYGEGSVDVPVKVISQLEGLDVIGAVGHQYVENAISYNTWRGGLTYNLKGFVLGVTYSDTDVDPEACDGQCDARFVFSIARSF